MFPDTKQVIVIRRDLKMRRGKEIAQGAHASMAFMSKWIQHKKPPKMDKHVQDWIFGGCAKICCYVGSEEELLELYQKAKDAKIISHLITDSGKTEFHNEPTHTAIAIGPDYNTKIDTITGHLKLY